LVAESLAQSNSDGQVRIYVLGCSTSIALE
jgi:hypothetical protein